MSQRIASSNPEEGLLGRAGSIAFMVLGNVCCAIFALLLLLRALGELIFVRRDG